MRPDRWLVWLLDEALDHMPYIYRSSETGRLSVCFGGYGCLMRLYRYWDVDA